MSIIWETFPPNMGAEEHGKDTVWVLFAPDSTQAGVHDVTFVVSDGLLADSATANITVTDSE
jgi:hypothetical protein